MPEPTIMLFIKLQQIRHQRKLLESGRQLSRIRTANLETPILAPIFYP
jgi:hypothetical protein